MGPSVTNGLNKLANILLLEKVTETLRRTIPLTVFYPSLLTYLNSFLRRK